MAFKGLLKDDELIELIRSDDEIIKDIPSPRSMPTPDGATQPPDPWYGPQSPVQASSIDLHVGAILVPGAKEGELGSTSKPRNEFALGLGHTVVIVTKEELNLPGNLAAFGFPPSRLSSRGLLMTNPGHVDPGFKGKLRFTVMNIATESITLREDDSIVTLLFFPLSDNATADYSTRNNLAEPVKGPTQEKVNCLSMDFLDVSSRADVAATKVVKDAEFRAKLWAIGVPALGAIATLAGAFFLSWQPMNQLRSDLDQVKTVLEMKEYKSKLDKLKELEDVQKRLVQLESKQTKTHKGSSK